MASSFSMRCGCALCTEVAPDGHIVIKFICLQHPMDRIAAAQDALLRVQHRVVRSVPDSSDKNVLARLLVPSNQIGCLLGKGGSIMAEMRKLSGAQIRILGKDQISKCASEHEEEVQVFFSVPLLIYSPGKVIFLSHHWL